MRGRHRKPKVTARNRRCEIRCITLKDQSREDRGSRAFPVISRSLLQRLSPESRLRMAPLLRFFCFFLRCFFFIYLGLLGRERGPLGGFPSVSFHFPRGRRGGPPGGGALDLMGRRQLWMHARRRENRYRGVFFLGGKLGVS